MTQEPTGPTSHRTCTTGWRPAILLLLLVFFAQVALAARHTSITLDEPLHITSGYACLVTGDYRLVEEHPPLLKMLQAMPLLLARPRLPDPRTVSGWGDGDLITVAQHVVVPYRPIEPLVFAARVPTMLVGVLLAALVYRWAADVFGPKAGLLALTLYAFDPNMLAHAGVAATDLGAACAIFAATYTFWRWLRQPGGPSWRRALIAAIVLGLALGVKSTALMLPPLFGAFILGGRPPGRTLWPYLRQALAAAGVAFLVLWAQYRFEIGSVPGLPMSLPAASHFLPLLKLQEHMRSGHSAFLMGRNYHHGVWTYFPVAFALKTPPLTLALLLLAALGLIGRRVKSVGWRGEAALLAFPMLYFGLSLTSTLNIGYRHLLPILPFIFVWLSRITHCRLRFTFHVSRFTLHASRFTFCALLLCYTLTTLTLFPWHLAYFNFLAGGPDGGYRYLTDSNLDWGQTWKALGHYLDEQGITAFGLSQYTINDPRAYGLDYTPLPPWPDAPPVLPRRFNPPPGVYAISATTLQGVVVADPEMFDYFRKREPVARVGHAMFVYQVEAPPQADWAAQCTNPVAPLPPEVLAEGLGREDLRLAYFDCSQSWLYPPGSGWYALARDSEATGGMSQTHLGRARLAYEQTRAGFVPPFQVYEWFGLDPLEGVRPTPPGTPAVPGPAPWPCRATAGGPRQGARQGWVHAAPGDWSPGQAVTEGVALTPPVRVGDALEFLEYVAEHAEARAGFEAVIWTYWRVTQTPVPPLSLMAHLLDENGVPIAIGDGLGVPVDQWRPGDIIVQRHGFKIPSDTAAGTYRVQVGAYTLPEIQRMPVFQSSSVVGDRLVVGQIEVIAP